MSDRLARGRIADRAALRPLPQGTRQRVGRAVFHEEVVLEAHEEARLARVSLPPREAAKRVVDATRLVPVGLKDEEAAERPNRLRPPLACPAEVPVPPAMTSGKRASCARSRADRRRLLSVK